MKLLVAFIFFISSISTLIAQTEVVIEGVIMCNDVLVGNVDVINLNTKKNSLTSIDGSFTLAVKTGDELYLISKEHFDYKLILTKKQVQSKKIVINISKRPIELKELVLTNMGKMTVDVTPASIEMARISKAENAPKVVGMYTGEMNYSPDLIKIFKILKGAKKKKEVVDEFRLSEFREYLFTQLDANEILINKLKLKPEEVNLFLSFCEKDPNIKSLFRNENSLETYEFLVSKNEEFRKFRS